MSEYAAGYRQTPRAIFETEGTLFEGNEDLLGFEIAPASSREALGVVATKYMIREDLAPAEQVNMPLTAEHEDVPVFRYPKQITDYQQFFENSEIEEGSVYDELGGRQFNLYQDLFEGYQPWMRDVRVAVERYGLLEMSRSDVAAMTQKDQRILGLYVDGFAEGLTSIKRLIEQYEGDVTRHEFFNKYCLNGYRPTVQEMRHYGQRVGLLERALRERGGYGQLLQVARDVQPNSSKRHRTRKLNKDTKKDTPIVRFNQPRQKWQVELIANGSE